MPAESTTKHPDEPPVPTNAVVTSSEVLLCMKSIQQCRYNQCLRPYQRSWFDEQSFEETGKSEAGYLGSQGKKEIEAHSPVYIVIRPNGYGKHKRNIKLRMGAHSTTTIVFIAYVGKTAALAII